MSKYIDLELALNELLRLYEEDVDRYAVEIRCGIKIPETFDYHRAKEALQSLPTIEVSEDCISREWVKGIFEVMLDEEMLGHMLGYIEYAPSVVPSRAEGEWIGTEYDGYADENPVYYEWICSECKCVVEDEEPTWNYCPNCGAKMKG